MQPSTRPGSDDKPSSLGHQPEGPWRFDSDVARVFDDMLERSIPDHAGMRAAVDEVGLHFLRAARSGTAVVDLGSSRGAAVARFVSEVPAAAGHGFFLVERSAPMLDALRSRFSAEIGAGRVAVYDLDLRTDYPPPREVALTLAVLTLQFTPIEHRQRIVRRAWESTVPGGALVVVEKVLGADARLDELLVELHHARKREAGYSQEEIDRKRLSLEGVLVPVTARWNEDLLRGAGFRAVEPIWRSLNFCAWVAVRE
jgi:tRNA (cmo5U34)-methyltransferase